MNPIQVKTRAELLATQLEARIANGEFGPGDMIGTMDELKQQSGYARSTVAEAIRLLTDRGAAGGNSLLAGARARRGAKVRVNCHNVILVLTALSHTQKSKQ